MPIPFLSGVTKIALAGFSRNPNKLGYKVYMILSKRFPDIKLYPINPNIKRFGEIKIYSSLRELQEKSDLVITVVPPNNDDNC